MSAAQYIPSSDEMKIPSLSLGIFSSAPPKRNLEEYNCVVLTDIIQRTQSFSLPIVNDIFDLYTPKTEPSLVNQLHIIDDAQEIFKHTTPLDGEAIAILRGTIRRVAKTKKLPTYR